MKIAVLGGTFNPLHNGHVMIAESACEKLGYDKVLFVPSFMPPHKIMAAGMTAKDRLEMVQGFCEAEGNGRFFCESCEMERGGISYTCDTLEFILKKYKNELTGKLGFILGEESAAEFSKWKNPDRITEMADLVIAVRKQGEKRQSGDENVANTPLGNFTGDFSECFNKEKFGYPFIELQNPVLTISSSEIRELIAEEKLWEKYVPKSISDYIKERGLYGYR
ncbi:MAG: nicotinate (nicotinamide) nucleotide adenylyltransferase [Treponema sp.]|nr:nicotinate (nicotinamide) nucleotide adenylyltransferase [Treponema sp.]